MKKAGALAMLAVGLAALAAAGFGATRHEARAAVGPKATPLVLTALPSIGTVYWRYDCSNRGPLRWSLGLRVWKTTATTQVRFRAGKLVAERELQPGDPTRWFPYSAKPVQWLAAGSGGEEGTVVGALRVDYGYPSREHQCFPYAPPRLTVQFYPRRYYNSRDFLRQFTK